MLCCPNLVVGTCQTRIRLGSSCNQPGVGRGRRAPTTWSFFSPLDAYLLYCPPVPIVGPDHTPLSTIQSRHFIFRLFTLAGVVVRFFCSAKRLPRFFEHKISRSLMYMPATYCREHLTHLQGHVAPATCGPGKTTMLQALRELISKSGKGSGVPIFHVQSGLAGYPRLDWGGALM